MYCLHSSERAQVNTFPENMPDVWHDHFIAAKEVPHPLHPLTLQSHALVNWRVDISGSCTVVDWPAFELTVC